MPSPIEAQCYVIIALKNSGSYTPFVPDFLYGGSSLPPLCFFGGQKGGRKGGERKVPEEEGEDTLRRENPLRMSFRPL